MTEARRIDQRDLHDYGVPDNVIDDLCADHPQGLVIRWVIFDECGWCGAEIERVGASPRRYCCREHQVSAYHARNAL